MAGDHYVGVDIGGTKVAAALVDAAGRVRHRITAATPRDGGGAVLDVAVDLVVAVAGSVTIAAVGVGSPGVLDASGTVRFATGTLPDWTGTPVRAELEARLGTPVAVDNDVRAMAYGEARHGAGRGHPDALYASIGTGIGGSIHRDGRAIHGSHRLAGEIGHLLVPVTGRVPCGCGRHDHLEAAASGPAIAADYAQRTGETLPLTAIGERMRAGDEHAAAAIAAAATLIGRALGALLCAIDVSAVVVGGGVAQLGPAFTQPLAAALGEEALPPLRGVPVLPAQLGTDAPLIGAALLARELAPAAR